MDGADDEVEAMLSPQATKALCFLNS